MPTDVRDAGGAATKPKVALLGPFAASHASLFQEKLAVPARLSVLPEMNARDLSRHLAEAEVIVSAVWPSDMPPTPRLKLLQICTTGLDRVDLKAVPPGVVVSNVYGHEGAVAEYALMGMLMMAHRVQEQMALFRKGDWRFSGYAGGEPHGEFAGSRVTIVGLGHIGCGIAQRSASLGATVTGVSRSSRPNLDAVHRWCTAERLDDILPETDFLVICCPETPETTGLIDSARIACLPASAVIVNVARGPIVDEEALFAACEKRRIAGAVLDVWYQYPADKATTGAPSRFPFAALDNVIMTPHSSGWTDQAIRKRWSDVTDNVNRFLRGQQPANVVART